MTQIEKLQDLGVTTSDLLEVLREWVGGTRELRSIINAHFEEWGYHDDILYEMDDLNDLMMGMNPLDIIDDIDFSSFNTIDDFCYATVWGYQSTDDEIDYYETKLSFKDVFNIMLGYMRIEDIKSELYCLGYDNIYDEE